MYHHMKVILDTNVVLSAAFSQRGASSKLLDMLADGEYEIALTLPLFLEYRDVLLRDSTLARGVDRTAVIELCEDLAAIAHGQIVYFLWRPWLRDPNDDLLLEAAVASGAEHIVTHNVRDFINQDVEEVFGISVLRPQEMLAILEKGKSQ